MTTCIFNPMTTPQRGIFYRRKTVSPSIYSNTNRHGSPNSTFAIIMLRINPRSIPGDITFSLKELWEMYEMLRKGKMSFSTFPVPHGKLSVLFSYSPNVFSLKGISKAIPYSLKQFLPPSKGGGDILKGSEIKYSNLNPVNLALTDDIAIQLIGSSQLAVHRAIVETWKHIHLHHSNSILQFSRFYLGFQRDDRRSWLGFPDEISNMNGAAERKKAIFIHPRINDLHLSDYWTSGGTYMAYLRIQINLVEWEKLSTEHQELVVGRDKETGFPLAGVDRQGRPVNQTDPKFGNFTKPTESTYLDHPDYFNLNSLPKRLRTKIDLGASTRILSQSHIGRARHIDGINSDKPSSRRIYRQGFDFIESTSEESNMPFRIGLNFVSFQNDPRRLFFILSDPNWMGHSSFGGESDKSAVQNLLSVLASGVFYVPPLEKPFPGVSIF
jgi:deferrochelatase/peroxidase EfeB